MARGKTLAQLVDSTRLEIGASNSVALGVDFEENVKETLRRVQEMLYDDYDWPHLNIISTKTLSAGSRYYDMPADMNFDRIQNVTVLYGGEHLPLHRGIGFDEYSAYDPTNNERADPLQRWDVRFTGVTDQIEVWPLPATAQTMYFEGIRDLPALTSDSSVAVLDDRMIVLFAAAEFLARKKLADAGVKQKLAQERYDRVKANSKSGDSPIQLGLGKPRTPIAGPTVIHVAS
jgi:hypothetical protein